MTSKPPSEVQAGRGPEVQAVRDSEVTLATLGYLGAVFTGPVIPLGVYLIGRRISPFTRYHAAMALNQSLTGLLYAVCCLILGGLLVLDSLDVATATGLPRWMSVWTSDDQVVTPPDSALLPGALDVQVQSVCPAASVSHSQLPTSPVVTAMVLQALGTGPLTRPTAADCG